MFSTPHKRGSHQHALHTGDPVKQPSSWAPLHLLGRKLPLPSNFQKEWLPGAQHLTTSFFLSLVEDAGGTGISSLASSSSQPGAHEVPFSGGAACPQPSPVPACPHPQEAVSPPWSGLFLAPNPFLSWSLGPPFPQLPPQTLALSPVCSQAVWALNPGKPGTSFPQGGWLVDSMLLCKLFLRILFYSSTQ